MLLLDELRAEHELIERVAGSFLAYAARPAATRSADDGAAFLRFFQVYAGDFHHAREEDTLFVGLRERAGLPGDRGPIATMLADHRRLADLLALMPPCIDGGAGEHGDVGLPELVRSYVHALWHHIDAENSVLFPECGPRLGRNGVTELDSRPMTDGEGEARAAGEALAAAYPQPAEGEVMRGDGCVMCPAFGVTCRGLELEWWNEWEWDEFEDRMNAG